MQRNSGIRRFPSGRSSFNIWKSIELINWNKLNCLLLLNVIFVCSCQKLLRFLCVFDKYKINFCYAPSPLHMPREFRALFHALFLVSGILYLQNAINIKLMNNKRYCLGWKVFTVWESPLFLERLKFQISIFLCFLSKLPYLRAITALWAAITELPPPLCHVSHYISLRAENNLFCLPWEPIVYKNYK